MKREELEVYSSATNAAAVKMPGRRFPGLVIQGDTFDGIVEDVVGIVEAAVVAKNPDLAAAACHLFEKLENHLVHYSQVLGEHGFALPFPSRPSQRIEELRSRVKAICR